jgi:hypothetical protein
MYLFLDCQCQFSLTEVAFVNRTIYKFLVTIFKDQCEDQQLISLIEVFWLVSLVQCSSTTRNVARLLITGSRSLK